MSTSRTRVHTSSLCPAHNPHRHNCPVRITVPNGMGTLDWSMGMYTCTCPARVGSNTSCQPFTAVHTTECVPVLCSAASLQCNFRFLVASMSLRTAHAAHHGSLRGRVAATSITSGVSSQEPYKDSARCVCSVDRVWCSGKPCSLRRVHATPCNDTSTRGTYCDKTTRCTANEYRLATAHSTSNAAVPAAACTGTCRAANADACTDARSCVTRFCHLVCTVAYKFVQTARTAKCSRGVKNSNVSSHARSCHARSCRARSCAIQGHVRSSVYACVCARVYANILLQARTVRIAT